MKNVALEKHPRSSMLDSLPSQCGSKGGCSTWRGYRPPCLPGKVEEAHLYLGVERHVASTLALAVSSTFHLNLTTGTV